MSNCPNFRILFSTASACVTSAYCFVALPQVVLDGTKPTKDQLVCFLILSVYVCNTHSE